MTAVAAAFVIPGASGMWTGDVDYVAAVGVGVGIISLAYILFGIMHHPAIALVGLGIAASVLRASPPSPATPPRSSRP